MHFQVFFGVMTGLTFFGNIGTLMTSFGSAQGAGAHIFHVLDNVPSINPILDRGLKPSLFGNIEFRDVYFEYPSRPGVTVSRVFNENLCTLASLNITKLIELCSS